MDGEKILIAESDPRTSELAIIKLSNAGYWVVSAADGEEALSKIHSSIPDLILISPHLSKKDGFEVCLDLQRNPDYRNIPIILVVDDQFNPEMLMEYGLKISSILVKPFSPKNLLGMVNSHIIRSRLLKEINPLTQLPGRNNLQERVNDCIAAGQLFTLVFADLKGFKTYNKNYGFEQGDKVIKALAELFYDEIGKAPQYRGELYHFGGDDFCIFSEGCIPEEITPFMQTILSRFDQEIPSLYSEEDRQRGGLVVKNRQGFMEQWPIMTLSLGGVSNAHRSLSDWLETEVIGLEMIMYAKTIPGSQFAIDRRRS